LIKNEDKSLVKITNWFLLLLLQVLLSTSNFVTKFCRSLGNVTTGKTSKLRIMNYCALELVICLFHFLLNLNFIFKMIAFYISVLLRIYEFEENQVNLFQRQPC